MLDFMPKMAVLGPFPTEGAALDAAAAIRDDFGVNLKIANRRPDRYWLLYDANEITRAAYGNLPGLEVRHIIEVPPEAPHAE